MDMEHTSLLCLTFLVVAKAVITAIPLEEKTCRTRFFPPVSTFADLNSSISKTVVQDVR